MWKTVKAILITGLVLAVIGVGLLAIPIIGMFISVVVGIVAAIFLAVFIFVGIKTMLELDKTEPPVDH